MRLRDLRAELVKRKTWNEEGQQREGFVAVASIAEADGLFFLCPKCFEMNGGEVGTHRVLCWFVGKVPDDVDPKPGRWIPAGTGIDDITFVGPAAASVLLTSGCNWHGFVRNGDAS
jgi:hypothetical protein